MAITDVILRGPPSMLEVPDRISRRYTATWDVTTDVKTGAIAVLAQARLFPGGATSAVPNKWDFYNLQGDFAGVTEVDSGSFAQIFRVIPKHGSSAERGSDFKWQINVEYFPLDPFTPPWQFAPDKTNPLAAPWIKWIEEDIASEAVIEGRNVDVIRDGLPGERKANTLGPLTNSAGDAPAEFPEVERIIPVLVVRKRLANLTAIDDLNNTFHRTTNNASFYGRTAASCRFVSARAVGPVVYDFGTSYVEAEIRVEFRPSSLGEYTVEIPDVSYTSYTGDSFSDTKRAHADADGIPVSEPLILDGNGVEADLSTDDVPTIKYTYLTQADYSNLGIGTTMAQIQ